MLVLLLACAPPVDEAPSPAVHGPAGHTGESGDTGEADDAPEDLGAVARPWLPPLVLNEVQTANDSTVMSEPGLFPDWLELFHGGSEPLDLGRVEVRLEGEVGVGLEGELAPGGWRLLFAEELGNNLSKEGERIELLVDGWVVDRLGTGQLEADQSWARFPDGGDWAVTARPTPGWTNGSRGTESLDPSELLFDDASMHHLSITLPEASRESLEDDRSTEVPAAFQVGAAWFPEVGVRLKGQLGSERDLDEKCSWKVDLREYAGHSWAHQETLTLNNMVQDPTYVAEHLAYEVYRAVGLPAPRTSWAWLSVDGEETGLYAVIETVDEHFLARWFTDPTGRLWEGKYGEDLTEAGIEGLELDRGPDDDRSTLYTIAEVLDGEATDAAVAELERLVDLDQWLASLAVEALILHWDGYTTANNYRLYEDPVSGRISLLPWGTDQTFIDLRYGPYEGQGDLMQWCLRNAGCTARYSEWLLEVADVVEELELEDHLDRHLSALAEAIEADPRAEHTATTRGAYVEAMRDTIASWPAQVRVEVANH